MARRPSGYVEITWHGLSSSPPASPATTCRWGRGARCRGQSADELCPFCIGNREVVLLNAYIFLPT